ncbi:importin subunit alpha-6-like [Olea europaea var. sylvestris]|uniref:importin subunit alpha-6-like n=1 Tax=Olea europaea var. sylvestris TaxID=158386 RepID=UPI000C1D49A6|nr:importin subunit alpha-6-like [Olea europaea var. sylvestris]
MIDDAEGLEKIENLQSHDNIEIYEKAVKILETYWLEEEDEQLPSGDTTQSGFNSKVNFQFHLGVSNSVEGCFFPYWKYSRSGWSSFCSESSWLSACSVFVSGPDAKCLKRYSLKYV